MLLSEDTNGMVLSTETKTKQYGQTKQSEKMKEIKFPRLSQIYEDSKILIFQDLPRFQDIDFPRCTINIQDFQDSKMFIFQDVP